MKLARCLDRSNATPAGENVKKIAHKSTRSTIVCPDASLQAHADQYLQAKPTSNINKKVKAAKPPPLAAAGVVYILVHSPAISLDNKKECHLPRVESGPSNNSGLFHMMIRCSRSMIDFHEIICVNSVDLSSGPCRELSRSLGVPSLDTLAGHYLSILHRHAVRVCMVIVIALHVMRCIVAHALCLGYWTIFVRQQYSLEIHNLLPELAHLCRERVILTAKDLDFSLQICKPLLLALSAFQCSNPFQMSVFVRREYAWKLERTCSSLGSSFASPHLSSSFRSHCIALP